MLRFDPCRAFPQPRHGSKFTPHAFFGASNRPLKYTFFHRAASPESLPASGLPLSAQLLFGHGAQQTSMVYFICQTCQETLKKGQVEKHWTTTCPNCYILTCVDCSKEFQVRHAAAVLR